jgi:hypothetical protein
MLDLEKSLQGRDLGFLQIVADLWGITLSAPDVRQAAKQLSELLLVGDLVWEVTGQLPDTARAALDDIMGNGGRLPWSLFIRRYGDVREIGPAKRDRERPYLNPVSPAEVLWYRALVGRAFFDSSSGPQEMAFVPQDLIAYIQSLDNIAPQPLGRLALPAERERVSLANDFILDHACSLLAAIRLGLVRPVAQHRTGILEVPVDFQLGEEALSPISPLFLINVLLAAGLVDRTGMPVLEPTRLFLESGRGEALALLVKAWRTSVDVNELRMLPGLIFEGEWRNEPLQARQSLLDLLASAPGIPQADLLKQQVKSDAPFVSLAAFVADVHQKQPDFQRPAGDYDSWYIRDRTSDDYLRGFDSWDAVDGAYIRFMICGPLHWLGIVDLARPGAEQSGEMPPDRSTVSAFRYSSMAGDLMNGRVPDGLADGDERVQIRSNGALRVPRLVSRSSRYQLARFCRWDGYQRELYLYRITPESLEKARQQDLHTGQLIKLLRRVAGQIPPTLIKAIERWELNGAEASIDNVVILRLSSPELSQAIQNSQASRYIEELLGPTGMIVKGKSVGAILDILAEMGYLGKTELG